MDKNSAAANVKNDTRHNNTADIKANTLPHQWNAFGDHEIVTVDCSGSPSPAAAVAAVVAVLVALGIAAAPPPPTDFPTGIAALIATKASFWKPTMILDCVTCSVVNLEFLTVLTRWVSVISKLVAAKKFSVTVVNRQTILFHAFKFRSKSTHSQNCTQIHFHKLWNNKTHLQPI